jgi:hypothetical protein
VAGLRTDVEVPRIQLESADRNIRQALVESPDLPQVGLANEDVDILDVRIGGRQRRSPKEGSFADAEPSAIPGEETVTEYERGERLLQYAKVSRRNEAVLEDAGCRVRLAAALYTAYECREGDVGVEEELGLRILCILVMCSHKSVLRDKACRVFPPDDALIYKWRMEDTSAGVGVATSGRPISSQEHVHGVEVGRSNSGWKVCFRNIGILCGIWRVYRIRRLTAILRTRAFASSQCRPLSIYVGIELHLTKLTRKQVILRGLLYGQNLSAYQVGGCT